MLLVDNDDCFIHTLGNYARQTGAEVVTYRNGFPLDLIGEIAPDLILISPGPGRPSDFGVPDLVRFAADRGIPTFGVCLGLATRLDTVEKIADVESRWIATDLGHFASGQQGRGAEYHLAAVAGLDPTILAFESHRA